MEPNIFVVGKQVTGESLIGYRRYIEKFSEILCNTVNNISITGVKRFGKTSLAKAIIGRVVENCPQKVMALYIDLAKFTSYTDFLEGLYGALDKAITVDDELFETFSTNHIYARLCEKIKGAKPQSRTYSDCIESFFKLIKRQGVRVILAIDEFDAAGTLFTETSNFEFLRDLSSDREMDVSLMLISRRQPYMIEKKNFNNSTFHGIIPTYSINGFTYEDLAEYYGILYEKYGILIDGYARERLTYYCGSSPFLYSMFAYNMVEDKSAGKKISVDSIYRCREIDIENYYKSIFACLKNDKVEAEGAYSEASTIEKLVGVILGPKINLTDSDLSMLQSMGYLHEGNAGYLAISGHFTNALKRTPLSIDTWNAILTLEKKLKSMIRKQIMAAINCETVDYDAWEKVFYEAGLGNLLDLYDDFIEKSMTEYDCCQDLLDVCGLDCAISIIQYNWEGMFETFFNNDDWQKWEAKLRLCAKARNPMAHGHKEILSPEERRSVNEYCAEIIKLLTAANACVDTDTQLKKEINIKKYNARKKYYSLMSQYESVHEGLKGESCKMTAAEQNNKGIKGYINHKGKYYACSIGKNGWLKRFPGVALGSHLSCEFDVFIDAVNIASNSLQLRLV